MELKEEMTSTKLMGQPAIRPKQGLILTHREIQPGGLARICLLSFSL